MIRCPYCKSRQIVKAGTRKTQAKGLIQVYKCKSCTKHPSEPVSRLPQEFLELTAKLVACSLENFDEIVAALREKKVEMG